MSIWQAMLQLIAAGMVISIVCRAVKMDGDTLEAIRWAMVAQGATAMLLAVVPFGKPHWLPWLIGGYMAANLLMQVVTARYWRHGQPQPFRRARSST